MSGKNKQKISNVDHQISATKKVSSKVPAGTAKGKKNNAQRAKKRAAARKVRKNKLLTLLSRYDKAVKIGDKRVAAKLLSMFKSDQLFKADIGEMRLIMGELNKSLAAVDKQLKQFPSQHIDDKNKRTPPPDKNLKGVGAAQKKLGEAQQRLKRAQTSEQAFFATLTKKQAKNGICPFCKIKRISVDTHVMDMHPPQWGEYLTMLGKIK